MNKIIFSIVILLWATSCTRNSESNGPLTKEILEFTLTKDQSIESFKNSEGEFFFVKITGMANTGDRYIYIDKARSTAYATDKDFKNHKVFTGTGDGPGEFISIGNISSINTQNKHFIINDLRYDKMVVFNDKEEYLYEIKLDRIIDPWDNSVIFNEKTIVFVKGGIAEDSSFTYNSVNALNKERKTIRINGTEGILGDGFCSFQIQNKYLFIAKETYPSYLVCSKEGELLKNGDLTSFPLFQKNAQIAAEILKGYEGLSASVIIIEDIFLAQEKIFILTHEWTAIDSYRTNMVLELTLDNTNTLNIEKVYRLDKEDDYLAIMVDEKRLIASSKRTGFLDIYTLPE